MKSILLWIKAQVGVPEMDQEEEYVRRTLKVLIYIEKNLDEDLSLKRLAKIACYSPFHFHRIFQAVVGETVSTQPFQIKILFNFQLPATFD